MDLKSGSTYWTVRNKNTHHYPKLKKDIVCDVAIIGGGISGALTAYNLRNEDLEIVLIDKNQDASQSTAASTALLTYELDKTLSELSQSIGVENAVTAYKVSHSAIQKLKVIAEELGQHIEFEHNTSLYLITKKEDYSEMYNEFLLRQKNGFEVTFLSQEELKSQYSLNAYGAIQTNESYSVDPIKLTKTLIDKFVQKGHTVFEETEITSIENTKEIVLKTYEGYSIHAKKVIWAGGYETKKIVQEQKIKILSTYVFVSKPLKSIGRLLNMQIWEHADPYLYMRSSENRLVIGGEDEEFFDPDKRDALIPDKIMKLQEKVSHMSEGYDIIPEYKWAGTFAESEDSLPYFGSIEKYSNIFFIIPCGGNGITFSLIGSEMVQEWLKGTVNKNSHLFKFGR